MSNIHRNARILCPYCHNLHGSESLQFIQGSLLPDDRPDIKHFGKELCPVSEKSPLQGNVLICFHGNEELFLLRKNPDILKLLLMAPVKSVCQPKHGKELCHP